MQGVFEDNITLLWAAFAAVMAAWFLGAVMSLYVEARRKRISDMFIAMCDEIGKGGKVPEGTGRLGWMRDWWKAACESAGNGWLSPAELAAIRETARLLDLRDDFGANWKSEEQGVALPKPQLCALVATALLCVCCVYASLTSSHLQSAFGALCGAPLVVCCLVAITDSDLRYRTIPTELSALLFCSGTCWQIAVGGAQGIVAGVLVAALFALCSFILHTVGPFFGLANAVGKGDIRLALCMLTAGRGIVVSLICICVCALGTLVYRKVTGTGGARSMMPMGPAMCLGIELGCVVSVLGPALFR